MAVLGVIAARGGSKRFPRKNVAVFMGKPLIAWTILCARKSSIQTLICSTDDDEIALTALCYGCDVLRRPPELATDEAKSEDVLRHALSVFPHEYVVLLQPTSPLRNVHDINDCVRIATHRNEPVVTYCGGKKNGAVYVAPAHWIQTHDFTGPHIAYAMPKERSLDIDYPDDLLSSDSPS